MLNIILQVKCEASRLPAGKYNPIVTHATLGKFRTPSNVSITSEKKLTTIKPDSGSTHGGQLIRIDGHGFPRLISDLSILLGKYQCLIEGDYGKDGEVYCTTPVHTTGTTKVDIQKNGLSQNFPSLSYTFSASHSPVVQSLNPANGHKGTLLTVAGIGLDAGDVRVLIAEKYECTVTSASATSVTCTVPEMKAGVMNIKITNDNGDSNKNVEFTNDLIIDIVTPLEGSFAGGRIIVITGKSFDSESSVSVCNQPCTIVSTTYSKITCLLPAYDGAVTTVVNCDLTVDDKLYASKFAYKDSLTPTLDTVSPKRSGTGGGVSITLTGTNFDTDASNVNVLIDGTACAINSVSETQIVCVTGSTKTTNMAAKVVVEITGKGEAVTKNDAQFEYIDVWSSPFTWGGNQPPTEGIFYFYSPYSGKHRSRPYVTPFTFIYISDVGFSLISEFWCK